jgi:uncharacterized protein
MNYEMQRASSGTLISPDERQMGLFIHLSQLINMFLWPIGIVVPIVLWQTQKEKMPALDAHGKMAVNWMISFTIYMFVSIILIFLLIGILTTMALAVIGIVFPIIGGIKANNGELWQYPMTIKFLK